MTWVGDVALPSQAKTAPIGAVLVSNLSVALDVGSSVEANCDSGSSVPSLSYGVYFTLTPTRLTVMASEGSSLD